MRPNRETHDPDVRLEKLTKRVTAVERRSSLPGGVLGGVHRETATGVQTGGGSTAPNGFRAFDWTHTGGDSLLDLTVNRPGILYSGYYSINLRVETTATLDAGAEWQAWTQFWSTPWGPGGVFGASQFSENRCYSNGTTAGCRISTSLLPWLMNDDADNGGGGADFVDLNVYHTNSTSLASGAHATASLFVVYYGADTATSL